MAKKNGKKEIVHKKNAIKKVEHKKVVAKKVVKKVEVKKNVKKEQPKKQEKKILSHKVDKKGSAPIKNNQKNIKKEEKKPSKDQIKKDAKKISHPAKKDQKHSSFEQKSLFKNKNLKSDKKAEKAPEKKAEKPQKVEKTTEDKKNKKNQPPQEIEVIAYKKNKKNAKSVEIPSQEESKKATRGAGKEKEKEKEKEEGVDDDWVAEDGEWEEEKIDLEDLDVEKERFSIDDELKDNFVGDLLTRADGESLKDLFKKIRQPGYFSTGVDECLERNCDNPATTSNYCRLHYIKAWNEIKKREQILKDGKLQDLIEELVSKYPVKYIDAILQDLVDDKTFHLILKELNIESVEESFDDELEDDDDSDIAFETKSTFKSLVDED